VLVLAAPLSLLASPAQAAAECDGQPATIVGTAGDDELVGTRGADVIAGLDGNDVIEGRGGDDVICGDEGRDTLHGGGGDDSVHGGLGQLREDRGGDPIVDGDDLFGGPGDDLFDGGVDDRGVTRHPDTVSYQTATRSVAVDLADLTGHGQGRDRFVAQEWRIVGSPYGDFVTGSDGRDVIEGRRGPDVIDAGGGDDSITTDPAGHPRRADADVVHGDDGMDYIYAEAGADRLYGDGGQDHIYDMGARGADRVFGGRGDDGLSDVVVDARRQRIDGGTGYDWISVGTHVRRDGRVIRPNGFADLAAGQARLLWPHGRRAFRLAAAESLRLPVRAGRWTVYGTADANTLRSPLGRRAVRFFGRAGDDELWGSRRADLLNGGPGVDEAHPLEGRDVCVHVERPAGCEVLR
jgi:Ca2+-binding RTX toxin-like protein